MTSQHLIAGVMSGTSLDGLDIAICRFEETARRWNFEILAATTIEYNQYWKDQLGNCHQYSGEELISLHNEFGAFIGSSVKEFASENNLDVQYIASHGHTVFHQPQKHFTFQIGNGAAIAVASGIDTICDFRSTDVALGGQGAPLVPLGDELLFGGHKFCLNLGGFANISYDNDKTRLAFDICPVNLGLNFLAKEVGKNFDEDGLISMSGEINIALLEKLNALNYYQLSPPKSLGREWFEQHFRPVISDHAISTADKLRTVTEHIGIQIANVLFHQPGTTILTTGGGALNSFLVEAIEENLSRHGIHVVVPNTSIIQFKEALIFSFLGLLRVKNKTNVLSSVTGSKRNSVSGCVYEAH